MPKCLLAMGDRNAALRHAGVAISSRKARLHRFALNTMRYRASLAKTPKLKPSVMIGNPIIRIGVVSPEKT
jgi:hypothetical protein